jgi:geranylgeranyl reductase family protein
MSLFPEYTPALIIGAGPAGVTTSLFLTKFGVDHLVIDKAKFPRDKICGDALSGKVVALFGELGLEYIDQIEAKPAEFLPCPGISFVAPNGKCLSVPFRNTVSGRETAAGFISKRIHFDQFMVDHLEAGRLREQCELVSFERKQDGVHALVKFEGNTYPIRTEIIVGAEGERSIVAKQLAGYVKSKDHYCAAVRAYYSGVEPGPDAGYIELLFLQEALPGYLWVFPLPNGQWNVGVGMVSNKVSKNKVNLKKLMDELLTTHPLLRTRFANAKPESPVQGWGLPLGSKKWTLAGERYLLTGDAGSLIDPFTGEGIGNAMYSGKLAAEAIQKALIANDFSVKQLRNYETGVYAALGQELKIGNTLQKLTNFPWFFNFVVGKAVKNSTLRETIICMFEDINLRDKLRNPMFYFRLLFNKVA